jgi:ADP-ribose pyrophosphatase YjhB (NUDIX family)
MAQMKKQRNPYLATDIIINFNGGIVLIERLNDPKGIAIPGGFHEWGLSAEANAEKEALEETNLRLVRPTIFDVVSDPARDPRGHIVSIVFEAIGVGQLKAGDDAKAARVYTYDEIRELIARKQLMFDHATILTKYLAKLPQPKPDPTKKEDWRNLASGTPYRVPKIK